LAAFVNKHADGGAAGWVLRRGYFHIEGSRFLYLRLNGFHEACGTAAIFRPAMFERFLINGLTNRYPPTPLLHYDCAAPGLNLPPLPFAGAVYSIRNGENIYMAPTLSAARLRREGKLRYYARRAARYIPIPLIAGLRRRFGLYRLG
jgi:hypothetical protein